MSDTSWCCNKNHNINLLYKSSALLRATACNAAAADAAAAAA